MSRASEQELKQVLKDIKALGYDLKEAADKAAIYQHIAGNSSRYTLKSGKIIECISIKYLFYLAHNQEKPSRLAPKS